MQRVGRHGEKAGGGRTHGRGDPPPAVREEKKQWIMTAVKDLTVKEYEYDYWFALVAEPDVNPTDNRAENGLREPINR